MYFVVWQELPVSGAAFFNFQCDTEHSPVLKLTFNSYSGVTMSDQTVNYSLKTTIFKKQCKINVSLTSE